MFLDCVFLVFLVLLQLPKKEAGAGMAFGGAATDALFGAGSGNVLTKITKYMAGIFFGLALVMALMASHKAPSSASLLAKKLLSGSGAPIGPAATAPVSAPGPAAPAQAPGTGLLQLSNIPAAAPSAAAAPAQPSSPPPASTAKTNR